MFTKKHKGPGRPKGRTPQGQRVRDGLYRTAKDLFAQHGYTETTMRQIAQHADVSPGLLYKYFPSKGAIVLELYDELSAELAVRAEAMEEAEPLKDGAWHQRAQFALDTSLETLSPHRQTLAALLPVLVGDPSQNLFSQRARFSRQRVQGVFVAAVRGAREKFDRRDAEALGRLLYVVHLAVVLWWLLDKSPGQAATRGLTQVLRKLATPLSLALKLSKTRAAVHEIDGFVQAGLFGTALSRTREARTSETS